MKQVIAVILTLIITTLLIYVVFGKQISKFFLTPTKSDIPNGMNLEKINEDSSDTIQIIAQKLSVPWEIVFLPDESMLVTERPGTIKRIYPRLQTKTIQVEGVTHIGEGGLQGMTLDPDYKSNHYVYLYATTQNEEGLLNRVERYKFDQEKNQLTARTVILDKIPGAQYHDGGRIKFGPDGMLYVATGDATQEELAQDLDSLAGKILRMTSTGEVPVDNPFSTLIYSYGHRNVQGLAWDDQNRLWATEHGPSGLETGNDEVNLIVPGGNYGWPTIRGDETAPGMIVPVIQSGTKETWAPAGMEIVKQTLYFTGLRGSALYGTQISGDKLVNLTAHLREDYGRLRFVELGPDSWLYIGTSNTDGRGSFSENDDQIIKVHPSMLGN